jgi:hypothetical protein
MRKRFTAGQGTGSTSNRFAGMNSCDTARAEGRRPRSGPVRGRFTPRKSGENATSLENRLPTTFTSFQRAPNSFASTNLHPVWRPEQRVDPILEFVDEHGSPHELSLTKADRKIRANQPPCVSDPTLLRNPCRAQSIGGSDHPHRRGPLERRS